MSIINNATDLLVCPKTNWFKASQKDTNAFFVDAKLKLSYCGNIDVIDKYLNA